MAAISPPHRGRPTSVSGEVGITRRGPGNPFLPVDPGHAGRRTTGSGEGRQGADAHEGGIGGGVIGGQEGGSYVRGEKMEGASPLRMGRRVGGTAGTRRVDGATRWAGEASFGRREIWTWGSLGRWGLAEKD